MNVQVSTLLEYGMTPDQVAALGMGPKGNGSSPVSDGYRRLRQSGRSLVTARVADDVVEAVDRLAAERGLSRNQFISMVLERCAEIGKRLPPAAPRPTEDPEEVIARVARAHGVSVEQIKGPRRKRHIVAARHECMVALRAQGLTLTRIARLVNREHHAVMHALRKAGQK